jgi:hypothetical protein
MPSRARRAPVAAAMPFRLRPFNLMDAQIVVRKFRKPIPRQPLQRINHVFCLRGVSSVFNGFVSGRWYCAAKLTAVTLACSGSGPGLNLRMPTIWDDVRAVPFGWLSFPNHSSNPVSTLPKTKK